MGEFTKRVRDGDIAGPLRRAFTPDKWNRAFGDLPAPDAVDHDIHAAGLALHEKLAVIRGVLKLSSSDTISATTKIRAFLALANYDFFVTRDKTKLAIEKFQADREGELEGSTPISRTVLKELQPSDPAWRPFCAS